MDTNAASGSVTPPGPVPEVATPAGEWDGEPEALERVSEGEGAAEAGPPLGVTLFRERAGEGGRVLLSRQVTDGEWREFASFAAFAAAVVEARREFPEKARLPLLKLGRYANDSRAVGAELERITGVEGDYDAGRVPLADAAMALAEAGITAVLYTSASHRLDAPRWRVLAPLSRVLPASDRARLVARLNGALGGILGAESFTLKQTFYVGRVAGAPFEAQRVGGARRIDEAADLDARAVGPADLAAGAATVGEIPDAVLLECIRTGEGGPGVNRSVVSLAARYIGRGMSADDARAALEGVLDACEWRAAQPARWNARRADVAREVRSAARQFGDKRAARDKASAKAGGRRPAAGGAGAPAHAAAPGGNGGAGDKRLEIRLLRGWDGYAVDQTVAALSGCGFVFRVGRRLVGVQRGSGGERPEVVELSAGNAVQWLPRAAGYFAPGKEGELLPCNVPGWLARAAVEAGVWPGMPELLGVSCAPMLRADGSFSAAVGFDAATGYFVDGAAAFPALPARVTETEALAALAELRELVAEFPFATVAAEASWLALVLTLVSRHLLAAVPAVFVNGTAPGAGKSLLVRVASIIHKGDAVGASVFPRESEELAKALLSELLTTPALVFYDNLPAGYAVASPELCAAITTSQFSARLLGSSTKATVPARAVFAFTGNNAGPAADMVRRSVIVRLELPPESEAPREFRIPALESHTLANWRRLHAAALMFLAGFIHAGRPGAGRLAAAAASFEEWGGLVRASLVWALGAEADPWATQALARDADEETGEGFALVCEIARALRADRIEPDERPREFLARDLRELALRPENNALRELLESRRRGSGGDVADVREIGRRLRSLLGRWVPMQAAAGRVSVALHQAGTRDHTAVFAIVVKLAAGAA